MIVCHPKQGSFWIHYSARSFAIYNPKERKPEFRRAARRRNGKSRGNEICRDEKKRKKNSPRKALPFSLSPLRVSLLRKARAKMRLARSLAPNKRRKFQRPASRESYLIERGNASALPSCSRVSTVALSRKKGVRFRRKFTRSSGAFSSCLSVTETESR